MRSGLASPYRSSPRTSTQGPTASAVRPAAARHSRPQSRQLAEPTCQAWANASRSTAAAASERPWCMDGRRANA